MAFCWAPGWKLSLLLYERGLRIMINGLEINLVSLRCTNTEQALTNPRTQHWQTSGALKMIKNSLYYGRIFPFHVSAQWKSDFHCSQMLISREQVGWSLIKCLYMCNNVQRIAKIKYFLQSIYSKFTQKCNNKCIYIKIQI